MKNNTRCTYDELMSMPNRLYHTLYSDIYRKSLTDEGKKQLAEENVVNTIKDELGG